MIEFSPSFLPDLLQVDYLQDTSRLFNHKIGERESEQAISALLALESGALEEDLRSQLGKLIGLEIDKNSSVWKAFLLGRYNVLKSNPYISSVLFGITGNNKLITTLQSIFSQRDVLYGSKSTDFSVNFPNGLPTGWVIGSIWHDIDHSKKVILGNEDASLQNVLLLDFDDVCVVTPEKEDPFRIIILRPGLPDICKAAKDNNYRIVIFTSNIRSSIFAALQGGVVDSQDNFEELDILCTASEDKALKSYEGDDMKGQLWRFVQEIDAVVARGSYWSFSPHKNVEGYVQGITGTKKAIPGNLKDIRHLTSGRTLLVDDNSDTVNTVNGFGQFNYSNRSILNTALLVQPLISMEKLKQRKRGKYTHPMQDVDLQRVLDDNKLIIERMKRSPQGPSGSGAFSNSWMDFPPF